MHSPAVAKDAHSRPFYGLLGTDTMNIIFSSVILIFFISLGRYFLQHYCFKQPSLARRITSFSS